MEIEGYSQLNCVERSESMLNRMNPQQPRGRMKVPLLDWWRNDDPILGDVRPEAAQSNPPTRGVENSRSDFDR